MAFFTTAVTGLKTVVTAIGAGVAVWALSIFWRVTEMIIRVPMLMYGKVTHMNLIDSRLLFPEAQDIITCPAFCICL